VTCAKSLHLIAYYQYTFKRIKKKIQKPAQAIFDQDWILFFLVEKFFRSGKIKPHEAVTVNRN